MPTYKPKGELKTRRSAGEDPNDLPEMGDFAATAIDRPKVDIHDLKQARLKEHVERTRRERSSRSSLFWFALVVIGIALAAGAGLGAFLALST